MEVQNKENENISNLYSYLSKEIEQIPGTKNIIYYCLKAEKFCYSYPEEFNYNLRKALECFLHYMFSSHAGDPEWTLPEKYIYDQFGNKYKKAPTNADYLKAAKISDDMKKRIHSDILKKANSSVHTPYSKELMFCTPQSLCTFEEILVEYFRVVDDHITPVSKRGINELEGAIKENDISKVRKLIDKGVVIDGSKSEIAKLALSCINDNKNEIYTLLKENGFDENNAHVKFKIGLLTYQIENGLWDTLSEQQKKESLILAIEEGKSRELEFILNNEGESFYKLDNGNTILHYAANGHIRYILENCSKYVDVNSQNIFGNTPLMNAAMNNKCEATEVLLGLGANIEIKNYNNQTAFEKAVIFGNEEIIKLYISKFKDQIDFNHCDSHGISLLMMSLKSDNLNIFKLLIDCGADINYSYKGLTIQILAVLNNSHKILKYLFFQGMKLPRCISNNDFDFSIVSFSSKMSVYNELGYIDVERLNIKQSPEISLFSFLWYTKDENLINPETFSILFEHGYKPDLYVIPGYSIFEFLFYIKQFNSLFELIELLKTNINQVNEIPVLADCVMKCKEDAIWLSEKLISLGIDPNVVNSKTGDSALHYACALGDSRLVKKLISLGGDIHKKNNFGMTPFLSALSSDIGEELISLYDIFENQLSDEERDAYFNETDNYGWSAFHYCIQNEEIVHFLLAKGLDCNKQSTAPKTNKKLYLPNGLSPLMLALATVSNKAAQTLIEFEADISLTDELGRNALFYACMNNNIIGIKSLLDLKLIDLHKRAIYAGETIQNEDEIRINGEEGTILDYAIKKENLPLIRMLLKKDETLRENKETKQALKNLKKSLPF